MNATLEPSATITDAQKRQYRDEGYFVLESVIPPDHLQNLRDEAARFIAEMDAEMDRQGVTSLGITHKNSRYFIPHSYEKSPKNRAFLFSPLMTDVCRATVGDDAFLFLDQYVIKAAERGMKFAWHQDEGYIPYENPHYVSCWCTLDDVTEENGTVYLLPYSRQGTREKVPHVREEGSNDMIGYFGDDPGIPVVVPAGSIAVFSSTVFHRSGPNTTDKMRRILLAQYSPEPIRKPDGDLHIRAVPFLKGGQIVADESAGRESKS